MSKISDLVSATALVANDLLAVVNQSVTRKITVQQILDMVTIPAVTRTDEKTITSLIERSGSGTLTNVYVNKAGQVLATGDGASYANGSGVSADYTDGTVLVPIKKADGSYPNVVKVFAGTYRSFYALDDVGNVYSWGLNSQGQLGHGDAANRLVGERIEFFVNQGLTITDVVCPIYTGGARYNAFFLTSDGKLYAAGHNSNGQLGDGSTTQKETPVRCGTLTGISNVYVGGSNAPFAFAINATGDLWSWGYNGQGQLGLGDIVQKTSPVQVSSITDVKEVIALSGLSATINRGSTLIRLGNGTVHATGNNAFGQLGQGNTTQVTSFTQISALGTDVTKIEGAGGYNISFYAITTAGLVYAWGENSQGQLGFGDTTSRNTPIQVTAGISGTVTDVIGCRANVNPSVIVLAGGRYYAVGDNGKGQTGTGDLTADLNTFAPILSLIGTVIDVKWYGLNADACAMFLLSSGRVLIAGSNSNGMLGVGHTTASHSYTPIEVRI